MLLRPFLHPTITFESVIYSQLERHVHLKTVFQNGIKGHCYSIELYTKQCFPARNSP